MRRELQGGESFTAGSVGGPKEQLCVLPPPSSLGPSSPLCPSRYESTQGCLAQKAEALQDTQKTQEQLPAEAERVWEGVEGCGIPAFQTASLGWIEPVASSPEVGEHGQGHGQASPASGSTKPGPQSSQSWKLAVALVLGRRLDVLHPWTFASCLMGGSLEAWHPVVLAHPQHLPTLTLSSKMNPDTPLGVSRAS